MRLLKRLGRLITRKSIGEQKVSLTAKATRKSFASLVSSTFFFFIKRPVFYFLPTLHIASFFHLGLTA
jgi:hypothetical protein